MRRNKKRLGPYELLEKLGQGGMGAVYKARHTKLNRIEAIKILPPHLAKDANAANRFEREIQAVGALNHPNIVQARHADEADGQLYLVMEFVDGRDLASLIKQHGRLPIPDACEIIRQAALGLQHAHEHGLVHRDIKPSNLMLSVARSRRERPECSSHSPSAIDPNANPDDRFAVPHEVTSSIAPFTVGHNLAQLVATGGAPVADPELASTFHHASSAEIGTGSNLECGDQPLDGGDSNWDCGDLSPLSIAAEPLSTTAAYLGPQSGSAANQSGDKSPQSKWRRLVAALILGGAAAFVLYGIIVIIRDKDGNEKARLKLDQRDKVEIVNDESDSKPAMPTADAATPKKIVIGPPVPRPPMAPLDLKPLSIDVKPGSPMSPCALVARPAPIDSVLSWTIELRQPRGDISGLAYNRDGALLASGGEDHVVRIWDAKTYALLKVLAGGSIELIHSVSWSPDGKYLAAGFSNGV